MSEEKRVLELDKYEYGAVVSIINEKRANMLGKREDTDFVDEILKKVIKAPQKKKSLFKKGINER